MGRSKREAHKQTPSQKAGAHTTRHTCYGWAAGREAAERGARAREHLCFPLHLRRRLGCSGLRAPPRLPLRPPLRPPLQKPLQVLLRHRVGVYPLVAGRAKADVRHLVHYRTALLHALLPHEPDRLLWAMGMGGRSVCWQQAGGWRLARAPSSTGVTGRGRRTCGRARCRRNIPLVLAGSGRGRASSSTSTTVSAWRVVRRFLFERPFSAIARAGGRADRQLLRSGDCLLAAARGGPRLLAAARRAPPPLKRRAVTFGLSR